MGLRKDHPFLLPLARLLVG